MHGFGCRVQGFGLGLRVVGGFLRAASTLPLIAMSVKLDGVGCNKEYTRRVTSPAQDPTKLIVWPV